VEVRLKGKQPKTVAQYWLTQILKGVKNCPFIMIVPDCDASAGDVAEIFSDYVKKIVFSSWE
jgi:hypothetical protein